MFLQKYEDFFIIPNNIDVFFSLLAFCLHKESHKQEIDGCTDGIHRPWCPDLIHANPEKEIEQYCLDSPVHQVTESEPARSFFVWFYLESKISGQQEIATETDNITNGVGYCLIHIIYKQ